MLRRKPEPQATAMPISDSKGEPNRISDVASSVPC
jgi:hypothetical protein